MRRLTHYGPSLIVLATATLVLFAGPSAVRQLTFEQTRAEIQLASQRLTESPILEELNAAYRDIATMVAPTVVYISTQQRIDGPDGRQILNSSGSGWIYDEAGHIVTNAHVVENAEDIEVQLNDGQLRPATLVGVDLHTDIAVVRIEPGHLHPAARSRSHNVRQGDMVFAFGSPFEFRFSMSSGIVSGLGRTTLVDIVYQNFIQVDAAINPGNSGGPLTNIRGEVIGMNTAIATGRRAANEEGQFSGIGLAIPIEMIESVVDQLIEHREVSRGYVGVRLRDIDDRYDPDRELRARKTGFTGNGVEVVYVEPDSPAADAGLQRNDVITHVRGTAVGSLEQLRSMISSSMPGDRLAITIWRSGDDEPRRLDITLARLDTSKLLEPRLRELIETFGFRTLTTATPELAAARGVPYRRGVVIETIAPGSALQRAGVKPGAVLTRVHDRNVGTVDEFYARLMRVEYVVRRGVLLTVVNPGETDPIEVPLR